MSSKNALQEHCVKHALGTLDYKTTKEGGADHEPEFSCTVSLSNSELRATGGTCSSKKDAEKSAASALLDYIKAETSVTITETSNDTLWSTPEAALTSLIRFKPGKTSHAIVLVIVDLDNAHSMLEDVIEKAPANVFCVGVCSTSYHNYATKHKLSSTKRTHLLAHPSTRRDATDMRMVAFACVCLQKEKVAEKLARIVFVSRDHMADAAVDAINELVPCMRLKNRVEVVACDPSAALELVNTTKHV